MMAEDLRFRTYFKHGLKKLGYFKRLVSNLRKDDSIRGTITFISSFVWLIGASFSIGVWVSILPNLLLGLVFVLVPFIIMFIMSDYFFWRHQRK